MLTTLCEWNRLKHVFSTWESRIEARIGMSSKLRSATTIFTLSEMAVRIQPETVESTFPLFEG